ELRDAWEAIEQAADQLRLAVDILSDSSASYLAGWFPGTRRHDAVGIRILPCILSSHRSFSGLHYDGIPVRDYSSLSLLFEGGIIRNGHLYEGGRGTISRHRIITEGGISVTDLDDYLSTNSKYFAMHTPFMHEMTRLETFAKKSAVLASETYAFTLELQNDYLLH